MDVSDENEMYTFPPLGVLIRFVERYAVCI